MNLCACIFRNLLLFVAAALLLSGSASAAAQNEALCSSRLGSAIPNFCEVKPDTLWRGSRPDRDAAAWLIRKGVQTIVNLEWLHDDLDEIHRAGIAETGTYNIDYFRVKTWEPLYAVAPSVADGHVIHFLAVAGRAKQPLYVHCRAGENRTGVMVAAYKIIIDDQTSSAGLTAVLDEMRSYHGAWSDFTTRYIEGLSLRRDEIIRRVKAFALEQPTRIVCKNGKCQTHVKSGETAKP